MKTVRSKKSKAHLFKFQTIFWLIVFLVCYSVSAFSDDNSNADPTGPSIDGVDYFPNKNKVDENGQKPGLTAPQKEPLPEKMLTYIKLGRSITTDSQSNTSNNTVGSLGYRRQVQSFVYGGEYTYHYFTSGERFQDVDLIAGFHPTWDYTMVPYAIGGFGMAFSSSGDGTPPGGSGVAYFADCGIDLFHWDADNYSFKTFSGLKLTHDVLTGGVNPTMNFTDFYIGIGIGW